jgi:hypothetical protein
VPSFISHYVKFDLVERNDTADHLGLHTPKSFSASWAEESTEPSVFGVMYLTPFGGLPSTFRLAGACPRFIDRSYST